jgi:hypothetical protein
MEGILSYLHKKGYISIDITPVINKNTYDQYIKKLINNPNVVAYFRRNEQNDILFKDVSAPKYYNYYFMNRDNYMFVKITNDFFENIKLCLSKFLEHGSKCEICLRKTERTVHCKKCYFGFCSDCQKKITKKRKLVCPQCNVGLNIIRFNMDEMKEYVSSKNHNYKNITSDVTERNLEIYLTDFKKNDFFVIIRDEHTEFLFTNTDKIQKITEKDDNMLMICRNRCSALKWKNKLEHEHKLIINTMTESTDEKNCEMCLINIKNCSGMNICVKCKYFVCKECYKGSSKCPRCKAQRI